jgi:hypothetical protein
MSRPACEGCGKITRVTELGLCPECHDEEINEPRGTMGEYEGYLPPNDED